MLHIKVVLSWPYARTGGVHPPYARAYAYAYHLCISQRARCRRRPAATAPVRYARRYGRGGGCFLSSRILASRAVSAPGRCGDVIPKGIFHQSHRHRIVHVAARQSSFLASRLAPRATALPRAPLARSRVKNTFSLRHVRARGARRGATATPRAKASMDDARDGGGRGGAPRARGVARRRGRRRRRRRR